MKSKEIKWLAQVQKPKSQWTHLELSLQILSLRQLLLHQSPRALFSWDGHPLIMTFSPPSSRCLGPAELTGVTKRPGLDV